jgi:hypothetical protein
MDSKKTEIIPLAGVKGDYLVFSGAIQDMHKEISSILSEPEFISLQPKQERFLVFLVEPYTWAWLAEKIAGGLVAAAIPALISALLGDDGIDLAQLLRDAVRQIKEAIHAELREDDLEKATAALQGIARLLRVYVQSPETWGTHLVPLADRAVDLYEEAKRLSVPAIGTLTIAASLRTAFFYEIAKKFKRRADWQPCRETALDFKQDLVGLRKDTISWSAKRFGSVTGVSPDVLESHLGRVVRIPSFFYTKDGEQVTGFFSADSAADARRRDIEKTTEKALAEIIIPAEAIADSLIERTPEKYPFGK